MRMPDFIRMSGRRAHRDLFDADLYDETAGWLSEMFGFNGNARRFAPPQRTSGGAFTAEVACDNTEDVPCGDDGDGCGFTYNPDAPASGCNPSGALPEGVGLSDDSRRSRDWEHPPEHESPCEIEAGQAGRESCRCPREDVPIPGSSLYFSVPASAFPLISRSAACGAEYVGAEVNEWLAELDEAHRLVVSMSEVPAVSADEPPITWTGAAARLDMLRSAARDLLSEGESDIRLTRLPESARTMA